MNKTIVHLSELETTGIVIADFWRDRFEKYFDLEIYDENKTYDKQQHIFWQTKFDKKIGWTDKFSDLGFKIIVDNLWDFFGTSEIKENTLMLQSHNFIFANESIWYKWLNYQNLHFNRSPDKFFLCLMRLVRPHREMLYEKISKYDDDALISFVGKNKLLYGDVAKDDGRFQRNVNPDWYNRTNFSIVSETSISDSNFISEKIFKPFAFKHPFVVWGPPNIFKKIKSLGFETFSHIIDETYESIPQQSKLDYLSGNLRLNKLVDLIDNLHKEFKTSKMLFSDTRSKEILEHNYNLFYSEVLINSIVEKEIFQPMIEFSYV